MRFRIPELRSPHRRFLLGLGLGVLASAAVALVTSLGYFSGYQGTALDLFFWAQGRARAPEIVLVGIDDAAFQRLNERQPLPRDYLAGLIRGLRKSGARAIGIDIDLRRPTEAADDRALAAAIVGATGRTKRPGGPRPDADRATYSGGRSGLPPLALVRSGAGKGLGLRRGAPGRGWILPAYPSGRPAGGWAVSSLSRACHFGESRRPEPRGIGPSAGRPGADRAASSRVGRTPGEVGRHVAAALFPGRRLEDQLHWPHRKLSHRGQRRRLSARHLRFTRGAGQPVPGPDRPDRRDLHRKPRRLPDAQWI